MGGNEHKHTQLNCYAAVLIYGVFMFIAYNYFGCGNFYLLDSVLDLMRVW